MFGQIPVWINEFNSPADLTGWQLHDLDGNGNQHIQGLNWYANSSTNNHLTVGNQQVLRYTNENFDNTYVPGYAQENNWLISPAIDLSGAGGGIQLAVYWNKIRSTSNGVGRVVYISTSPDLASFQSQQANVVFDYWFADDQVTLPADPNQFAESIIDISAFAGQTIYLGIFSGYDSNLAGFHEYGINIAQIAVFAGTLGTNDIKSGKSLTKVKQNPVSSALQLQLNPAMAEGKTQIKVYNAAGQQLLDAKYAREIPVSQLAPGMYIVQVTDGTLTERVKFIKK